MPPVSGKELKRCRSSCSEEYSDVSEVFYFEEAVALTQASIRDIPDEILGLIFVHLDLQTKVCTLPLVCRRWAKSLSGPSDAWSQLDLWDVATLRWSEQDRRDHFVAWLKPRCCSVRQLDVSYQEMGEVLAPGTGLHMPSLESLRLGEVDLEARVVAQVAHCAPTLTELQASVELGPSGGSAGSLVADLQPLEALVRLMKLDLNFEVTVPCPPCITALTCLQRLGLHNVSCLPLEVVVLPALRCLALGINSDVFPKHVACGSQLTQLALSFLWGDSPVVALPPEIGSLTGLASLRLSDATVLGLECISSLTALTSLKLAHLRLAAVPHAVSCLTRLRELDLCYNRIRAVPEFACLHGLERLHMRCQGGGGAMSLPVDFARRCAALQHLCLFPGCKPLPVTIAPYGAAVEPVFEGNQLASWKLKLRRLPVGCEAACLAQAGEAIEFLSSRCRKAIYCSGLLH